MENCLLYSVSVLFFFFEKTMCTRKNPLYFPLFLKLFESFSLFTSKHRKNRQKKKTSFFCFCPVPLLFHFFKHFSYFLHFHRCCLCSLFPFIFFVHLFLLFSPFSFSLFSPSLIFFFILSVSLPPFSSIACFLVFFSIAVLCIFFWINSFFFSLFCS